MENFIDGEQRDEWSGLPQDERINNMLEWYVAIADKFMLNGLLDEAVKLEIIELIDHETLKRSVIGARKKGKSGRPKSEKKPNNDGYRLAAATIKSKLTGKSFTSIWSEYSSSITRPTKVDSSSEEIFIFSGCTLFRIKYDSGDKPVIAMMNQFKITRNDLSKLSTKDLIESYHA